MLKKLQGNLTANYFKNYYINNREKRLQYQNEYYKTNKAEIMKKRATPETKLYHENYYFNNKNKWKTIYNTGDKNKQRFKLYYSKNQEKIKIKKRVEYQHRKQYFKDYYENNKDKIKANQKKKYDENNKLQNKITKKKHIRNKFKIKNECQIDLNAFKFDDAGNVIVSFK